MDATRYLKEISGPVRGVFSSVLSKLWNPIYRKSGSAANDWLSESDHEMNVLLFINKKGLVRIYKDQARNGSKSGNCNIFIQIDILNKVQKLDALIHRSLKSLSSAYQTHTAGTLVDDCSFNRICKIVFAGSSA